MKDLLQTRNMYLPRSVSTEIREKDTHTAIHEISQKLYAEFQWVLSQFSSIEKVRGGVFTKGPLNFNKKKSNVRERKRKNNPSLLDDIKKHKFNPSYILTRSSTHRTSWNGNIYKNIWISSACIEKRMPYFYIQARGTSLYSPDLMYIRI